MNAFQSPIPPSFWEWLAANKAWADFPAVFLILAFLLVLTWVGRWFWIDFKAEAKRADAERAKLAAEDRLWRETQNDKREQAQDAREKAWRDILASQYAAINEIASSMLQLSSELRGHDDQAKRIMRITERIDDNTRPLPGKQGYDKRKVE